MVEISLLLVGRGVSVQLANGNYYMLFNLICSFKVKTVRTCGGCCKKQNIT